VKIKNLEMPTPAKQISEDESIALENLVKQVMGGLYPTEAEDICAIIQAYRTLAGLLNRANITIAYLKRLLGFKRENRAKPTPDPQTNDVQTSSGATEAPPVPVGDIAGDTATPGTPSGVETPNSSISPTEPVTLQLLPGGVTTSGKTGEALSTEQGLPKDEDHHPDDDEDDEQKKANGHGRRGSEHWPNAERIHHQHPFLKPGDECPKCEDGTLYPIKEPGVTLVIVASPPLHVQVHTMEKLRCSPCGYIFTAPMPEVAKQKSTPEANAMVVVNKYYGATPYNRMANLNADFGQPIPRSELHAMATRALGPAAIAVYESLKLRAAQAYLVSIDDTKVKIIEYIKENRAAAEAGKPLDRPGMHTSALLFHEEDGKKVHLFMHGRNHAGENLHEVLKLRKSEKGEIFLVCDGIASNTFPLSTAEKNTGGCWDHLRRKFIELEKDNPTTCKPILDWIGKIYKIDKIAKKKKMSPEERRLYHVERSEIITIRLKEKCEKSLEKDGGVEPNSPLGKAMKYLLNQFTRLTLFLRAPGIPISTCLTEQTLKQPIAVRKLGMFFKNETGAKEGAVASTLIANCLQSDNSSVDFLAELQKNEAVVLANPALWHPDKYQDQLKKPAAGQKVA
jgi:transposase